MNTAQILSDKGLLPQHQKLIDESAISPDVSAERGYSSVTKKAELRRLGFSDMQCRVPTLLHPVCSVAGEIASYQSRPDQPRIKRKTGKPIKYETPSDSRMLIDVPPQIRTQLADPAVSLFITEGIRKADSAVSHGLCCIDVLGVWNWRGTNEWGGKTVLADWEYIALNNRKVYIVFDSDVMEKPAVHSALGRLQGFLKLREAKVFFIYLPSGDSQKTGLDDFLAAGHSVEDLMSLVSPELRDIGHATESESPYVVNNGRICYRKPTKDGEVLLPLCNFDARILAQIIRDDGAEQRHEFEIEGQLYDGSLLPRATVPARQFTSTNWVVENWGVRAVLSAGFGAKDRLREAMQIASENVQYQQIYQHTGWRSHDKKWSYLHAGGGVGAEGIVEGIAVEPEDSLRHVNLEIVDNRNELASAIRASLGLLDLGPDHLTVPVLAAVYRAPLNELLATDFSLHLCGPTGTFKSEIAALAQCHFGKEFTRENLPGNFHSTPNYLERLAFLAKDMLLVIDDFAPGGTAFDIARSHKDADRVFRGAGNRSGRGRLRPDSSARPSYRPRCTFFSTGEDVPRGQSLRARLLIIEAGEGDVDTVRLTQLQADRDQGLLTQAMAAYLRWLAPQLDNLRESLKPRRLELRANAANEMLHRRSPDIAANLFLGLDLFLSFSLESGAISAQEAKALVQRCWNALGEVIQAQSQHQSTEDPVEQFLGLLEATFSGGLAYLTDKNTGGEPEEATSWGWREELTGQAQTLRPQGRHIGWIEGCDLYLEPNAAFAAVQRLARDQGENLAVTKQTLWKRLKERGLLASWEKDKNLARITLSGKRRHVVHMHAEKILHMSSGTGTPGTVGTEGGDSNAVEALRPWKVPLKSNEKEEEGQDIGAEGKDDNTSGPIPPNVPECRTRNADGVEAVPACTSGADIEHELEGTYL